MKRITYEEVREAYRVTGRIPKRGTYFYGPDGACGLGVLALKGGVAQFLPSDADEDDGDCRAQRWLMTTRRLTEHYLFGFAEGFDGAEREFGSKEGYEDGKAVATRLIEDGLLEV